jgi:hypothetical protein
MYRSRRRMLRRCRSYAHVHMDAYFRLNVSWLELLLVLWGGAMRGHALVPLFLAKVRRRPH